MEPYDAKTDPAGTRWCQNRALELLLGTDWAVTLLERTHQLPFYIRATSRDALLKILGERGFYQTPRSPLGEKLPEIEKFAWCALHELAMQCHDLDGARRQRSMAAEEREAEFAAKGRERGWRVQGEDGESQEHGEADDWEDSEYEEWPRPPYYDAASALEVRHLQARLEFGLRLSHRFFKEHLRERQIMSDALSLVERQPLEYYQLSSIVRASQRNPPTTE